MAYFKVFSGENEKAQKISVQIAGNPTKIQTQYHSNTSVEWHVTMEWHSC
jgi:hypothetical protein